jgi:hypothetical protein
MTNITAKTLKRMPSGARACKKPRRWFKSTFPKEQYPNGASLRVAWRACPRDDWRVWFALNWLPIEQVQGLAWRFAGQAMRLAGIDEYADNVTADNWKEARATTNGLYEFVVDDYEAVKIAGASNAVVFAYNVEFFAIPHPLEARMSALSAANQACVIFPPAIEEQVAWCEAMLFQEAK